MGQKYRGLWGEWGYGIATYGNSNVYVTGYFGAPEVDFNSEEIGGMLKNVGDNDGFIVKFGCSDTSFLVVNECKDSYVLNGETYTSSGIYEQYIPTNAECDSVLILDLKLYELEPEISVHIDTLSTAERYASYQWIKNGLDIPGATNSVYKVLENGGYQVRVIDEYLCEKTSAVYEVKNVNIRNVDSLRKYVITYPNPVKDILYVRSPIPVNLILKTIDGRSIKNTINTSYISVEGLAEGMYFLHITDKEYNLINIEKIVVGNK